MGCLRTRDLRRRQSARGVCHGSFQATGVPGTPANAHIWLRRRLPHPDTLVPGGPEIHCGVQTDDVFLLGDVAQCVTENADETEMKPISIERFNALAGYIRSPWTSLSAKELAWYEAGDEKLLGLVSLDICDLDYVATVLARDAKKRFRAFALTINLETQDAATEWLDAR